MTPLDADEAVRFRNEALGLIEVVPSLGAFFKLEHLVARGLCAAIFEGDFRDADAVVTDACTKDGVNEMFCASLTQEDQPSFRFPVEHTFLAAVRERYHIPSYAIADRSRSIVIVSDSDYYWGICARPDVVSEIAELYDHLRQNADDIQPYLRSEDTHEQRLGQMLQAFQDVCDASCRAVHRGDISGDGLS